MQEDNVIDIEVTTNLPLTAEKILDAAKEYDLTDALIIGYDADDELYFAGTTSNVATVNLMLDQAKQFILDPTA